MSVRIEILEDMEKDRRLLADAWARFAPAAIPSGLALEPLFAWWDRYGSIDNARIGFAKRPCIVLIYLGNQLIGVLPLMRVTRFKKKIFKTVSLEFLTQSFAGDYLDLIHDGMAAEQVGRVFDLLRERRRYDLVHLCYLPENSLLRQAGIGASSLHAGKVIIPLDRSYEKVRGEVYSKNLRHVLNKFERRIGEAQGHIRSRMLEGREEIEKFKDRIKEVSLSKLRESGMHSVYQDPMIGEIYFASIIKMERPFCSVYFNDDQLLAYNMGYVKDNVVCAFDAAYNRTYAEAQKIGLGILAYDRIVAHYAGKCAALDMGFGLDDYKFRFSKRIVFTHSLLLKGNTLKSRLLYDRAARRQRRCGQALLEKVKGCTDDK